MAELSSLLVLFLTLGSLSSLSLAQTGVDCATFNTTCASCVSAGPDCQWCSTTLNTRCLPASSMVCAAADIVNPRSEVTTVPLSVEPGDNQVSVSTVRLKLRVGEPQSFRVSVRAQDNFPLDLYMLMDLSASFLSDLDTVKSIAPNLVGAIRNLTARFRVGFGAFVDKTTAPFNAPISLRLGFNLTSTGEASACSGMACSRPVSYEHVVNLTNSTDLFDQSVQDLIISTSSDDPEGTLDAMMQAVVCTDVVGWREEARKVLLVMTDDFMHTAGDGRLAGIYRPNDAKCRTQFDPTENKTLYSASRVYDYPTVEQMRMVLEQFGVVPVFAVSGEPDYFADIAQRFSGFSESLDVDARNLIAVIQLAYNQLVNSSRLEFPQRDYLQVNISADCPVGSVPDNNGCSGIGNNIINFTVTVTLTRCPENLQNFGQEPITVFVRPAFGRFTIELEGHCSCECERNTIVNSPSCSGNGNLTCGLCSCSEGWTGDDCSCSTATCPSTTNGECSGSDRGECVCAACKCLSFATGQRFFGDTCECDNLQCLPDSKPDTKPVECNNRGTCDCNNGCDCGTSTLTGVQHRGPVCQCNTEDCVAPNDACRSSNATCDLCNDQGTCTCSGTGSRCTCAGVFFGDYCQLNTGEQRSCSGTLDCIMCFGQAAQAGVDPDTICPNTPCTGYTVLSEGQDYNSYVILNSFNNTRERCTSFDGMCTFEYFQATARSNDSAVYHVLPVFCLPLPSWGIALVILFALLIFGFLILIFVKLIYVWLDYREVRRLRLEVQNTKFTTYQSPLYHDPNVTYTNVKYGKEE